MAITQRKKSIKKSKYSRLGCQNCKIRRLKCGEELDQCYNCLDKNIKCNYLNLSIDQKQSIIESHKNNEHYRNGKTSITNTTDNYSFQSMAKELSSFRFDQGLSKFSAYPKCCDNNDSQISNSNSNSTFPVSSDLNYKSSFGVIDFSNNYQFITNSPDFQRDDHPINQTGPGIKPLNKHEQSPTSFKIIKFIYHDYPTSFHPRTNFKVCGEEDNILAHIREIMKVWYFDYYPSATHSLLVFYALIAKSCKLLTANFQKKCYKDLVNYHAKAINHLNLLYNKTSSLGFKKAQKIIENLTNPAKFSNKSIIKFYKYLVQYSMLNMTIYVQNDNVDLNALGAYFNGFISSAATIDVFKTYYKPIEEELYNSDLKLYLEFSFFEHTFDGIKSFFLKSMNSIYIPSYNIRVLDDFFKQLIFFSNYLNKNCLGGQIANLQLVDLIKFFETQIFNNKLLLNSHDPEKVTEYNVALELKLMNEFFDFLPSELFSFNSTSKTMSAIDKIIYLFCCASGYLLDNIFPEAEYFFATKFSGSLHWMGFEISLINSILTDLTSAKNSLGIEVYEFLYRKTIWITRIISFLSHRHRTLIRNLILVNPFGGGYHNVFNSNGMRFKSRKPKFLIENQPLTFTGSITSKDYPSVNRDLISKILTENNRDCELAHPSHPANVTYKEGNDSSNINIDENYQQIQNFLKNVYAKPFDVNDFPIEMMKFNEFGLLLNIDYRPNLVHVERNYIEEKDFFTFKNPVEVVKQYNQDREIVVTHMREEVEKNLILGN